MRSVLSKLPSAAVALEANRLSELLTSPAAMRAAKGRRKVQKEVDACLAALSAALAMKGDDVAARPGEIGSLAAVGEAVRDRDRLANRLEILLLPLHSPGRLSL